MKRVAKIEIVTNDRYEKGDMRCTGYHWHLIGGNEEILCHSEQYATRSNALRAARRAKTLFQEAEIGK